MYVTSAEFRLPSVVPVVKNDSAALLFAKNTIAGVRGNARATLCYRPKQTHTFIDTHFFL
jgi:hypothetical protein